MMSEQGKTAAWVPEAIRFGWDEESGAEIEQLTSEPVTSTNIYCEQRYASADGTRIAIERAPFGRPRELWVCDLRSLRLRLAAEGRPIAANARHNAVYYLSAGAGGARLMRLDLADISTREMHRFGDGPVPANGAVSPDERLLVCGPFPAGDNRYRIERVDLAGGRAETLCEIADAWNPHLQFEPAAGRLVLVQVNRGGRTDPTHGGLRLSGPIGATLCAVDVETGAISPLPAGRPHTPRISGHACWAGASGRVLFTAAQYRVSTSSHVTLGTPPETERHLPPAAIYSAAPGDPAARVIAHGLLFNHLAASDDGQYYVADDHATGRVYIGSTATGRCLGLCDSRTRQGACQHSHAHAYLAPGNRHAIFNSIVTGVAQVYAAAVPDGFLEKVAGR